MHFIFILLIFFMDGIGWITLLRFCPCLKELLFQEEAPNAVFCIIRPYFCSWDVWRSQDKTCKPARFLKGKVDQLRMKKILWIQGILPIKLGCCENKPTGSADEGKLQHKTGSPEQQSVATDGNNLKICFPALSPFQSFLYNLCSPGGHLQGLVTKQERFNFVFTSCQYLRGNPE